LIQIGVGAGSATEMLQALLDTSAFAKVERTTPGIPGEVQALASMINLPGAWRQFPPAGTRVF
jgi:hypothetical protein